MVTFSTISNFTVCPEKWDSINDRDIKRMFEAFFDWLIGYEEHMTFQEADKAWKMHEQWKDYLEKRGIAVEDV